MRVFSVALFVSLASALQDDGTCLALVMGGGANNGAWQAGLLYGLMHYGDSEDF